MKLSIHHYRDGDGWDTVPAYDEDSAQTLVLAFGSDGAVSPGGPLAEISERFGEATLIGCSTGGDIRDAEVADGGAVVAVARFAHSQIRSASAPIAAANSAEAGRAIGAELAADDLRAVIVMSEGLDVNGSELVAGLLASVPEGIPVTGGLAADQDRFDATWVLTGEGLARGVVSAVGLYGERLIVGCGSGGGWDQFGPERRITRSEGNVLYELDGKPALGIYKEYLGEKADGLPASGLLFPLALGPRDAGDRRVVRTILGVDEEASSLTFAGDVPEGSIAQLMTASFDRLVEGAEQAARGAAEGLAGDLLSVAVSCVGRRWIMGEACEDELEATLAAFPSGSRQVGFYSYGEISPLGLNECSLQNQTMTVTSIGERAAA